MADRDTVNDRNSTTGRSIPFQLRAVRAWFAALSAVAPCAAEWHAARIFFTPKHRPGGGPGTIAGDEGEAFTVDAGGSRVACWSCGRGPTVLLVHGWGGSSRDWDGLAPRLVAAGYRVVLFDGPAHGASSGRRTTLPRMARAIHAIADHVAMGRGGRYEPLEAVVAHSFGGAAAVLAARDGLAVRDLVLLAPVAEPMSFVDEVAGALGLSPARTAGMVERIRVAAGGDLSRIDVVRAIAGSTLPGLVVHDHGDARVPYGQGSAIADAWPRARFVTTRGLGHRGILHDACVLDLVVSHLQRAPNPATPPAPAPPRRPRPGAEEDRSAVLVTVRGEAVPR